MSSLMLNAPSIPSTVSRITKVETFVPHKTHVCAEGGDVPGFRCQFKLVVALIDV